MTTVLPIGYVTLLQAGRAAAGMHARVPDLRPRDFRLVPAARTFHRMPDVKADLRGARVSEYQRINRLRSGQQRPGSASAELEAEIDGAHSRIGSPPR